MRTRRLDTPTFPLSLALLFAVGIPACAESTRDRGDGGNANPFNDFSVSTTAVCGNGTCEPRGGEDCGTCPGDCGMCAPCAVSPLCENAEGVPANPTRRGDLDKPTPTAQAPLAPSTAGCATPKLRMRLKQLKTNRGGSEVYCLVNGSDGATSEISLTNKTRKMGANDTFFFDPVREGIFWGQKELHPSKSNVTITYNCFRVVTDDLGAVLKALGDAAMQAGGVAGQYGWAFGLAGVGANVAAAALGANTGDKLDLNIQQTIPKEAMMALTNGAEWTIAQGDWTITIQAWGCADGAPR